MEKLTVLFISADPGSGKLRLDVELRAIHRKLRSADLGDRFELRTYPAARPDDLLQALNEHRPQIVHFSGHGSPTGAIVLSGDDGGQRFVDAKTLKHLFRTMKDNIRVVVLNSCYSRSVAEAITETIDCAIGMNAAIGDEAAICFAASFYRALGFNSTVENAFEQGRSALLLESIPEEHIPELLVRPGVDASRLYLLDPPELAQRDSHSSDPQPKSQERGGTGAHPPRDLPTGRSFLSYRRSRRLEAELLIAAQHDRGIPTWRDVRDLDEEPTEDGIRKVIQSGTTANAILWLTPDVKDSIMVRQVEVPSILDRTRQDDGFFVIPALAGGLDQRQLPEVLDKRFAIDDLRNWNLQKVNIDPIGPAEAAGIANRVLRRRVRAIHDRLPEGEPLKIELYTRTRALVGPDTALALDWNERFDGRQAKPGAWDQYLLPALKDVVQAIHMNAPRRAVEASGLLAIPAATSLGYSFLEPLGVKIAWRQRSRHWNDQLWSLAAQPEASGFQAETASHRLDAEDLAVLVSVASNVVGAFSASQRDLGPFRAIVRVEKPGADKHDLATPGQALDVANVVRDAVREARNRYHPMRIHFFMAVPVGLAMMIGQLMNFLPIQTYEHIPVDAVGRYHPAATLDPTT